MSAVFFGILLLCFAGGVYRAWRGRWKSAVLLLALAVVGLVAARPAPLFGIDGRSLQVSFGGRAAPIGDGDCQRLPRGEWRCRRYDDQIRSWVPYRVRVDGLGCWHGTVGWPGEKGAPSRVSDCVHIYDYLF